MRSPRIGRKKASRPLLTIATSVPVRIKKSLIFRYVIKDNIETRVDCLSILFENFGYLPDLAIESQKNIIRQCQKVSLFLNLSLSWF